MDGSTSTARGWFAVTGRQDSLPAADKVTREFFLRWPRAGVLELGASPEAVAVARHHVAGCLGEWASPPVVRDDMVLICSELVSNAIQATLSRQAVSLQTAARVDPLPIGLRLLGNWQSLVLEVWDCHPGVPVRQAASDESECGRGLAIVHELANRWGSRRLSAHVKAVWAELLLPRAGN